MDAHIKEWRVMFPMMLKATTTDEEAYDQMLPYILRSYAGWCERNPDLGLDPDKDPPLTWVERHPIFSGLFTGQWYKAWTVEGEG